MSDSTLFKEVQGSLTKRLAEWLVIGSWLTATFLVAKFGDSVFDTATSVLGKQWLLQIVSLLLFLSVYFLVLWLRSRKKDGVLTRLRVVKGKGYSIDSLTGEPVCPRCTTDEQAFPMRDHGSNLLCWACTKVVIK